MASGRVVKEQLALHVRGSGSEQWRVVEDMSVGDGDVEQSVVVVVEKRDAEADERQRLEPDAALGGGMREQASVETAIERVHVEIEVRDGEIEPTGAVVVAGVGARAGARA